VGQYRSVISVNSTIAIANGNSQAPSVTYPGAVAKNYVVAGLAILQKNAQTKTTGTLRRAMDASTWVQR